MIYCLIKNLLKIKNEIFIQFITSKSCNIFLFNSFDYFNWIVIYLINKKNKLKLNLKLIYILQKYSY
jgi:hypothetical protein